MTDRYGDSRASLQERLGLRPGIRIWLGGHHRGYKRVVEDLLAGAARPATGPIDAAFVCAATADEAVHFATKVARRLTAVGSIWVIGPADVDAAGADSGGALDPAWLSGLSGGGLVAVGEPVCLTSTAVANPFRPRSL